MKKDKKRWVRILALVLVGLMAFSTILAIVASALGEEQTHFCEMQIETIEDEQALHISQRLVYHNATGDALDRVVFYAAANVFRRESALFYENDALTAVFPYGYAPAGIELQSVTCDGKPASWAYQGKNETALRVFCDLPPAASCTFEFDYYVLLSENFSFLGCGETDIRLSAFYFAPAVYSETYGEFVTRSPLQFTRWMETAPMDFDVTLTLPDTYLVAATGSESATGTENHRTAWHVRAENAQELALTFGRRYRETDATTDSGVTVRVLSNDRRAAAHALDYAVKIIDLYEMWLGEFPLRQIDIAQSDYPLDALNFPGMIWLPAETMSHEAKLEAALRFCLAQQYLGMAARTEQVADAWLSDAPCLYLSLLAVEEMKGHDAFLNALNAQVLDALNITVPGGLYVTADASLFDAEAYALIVRGRGTAVMHELRSAMGRENLLVALRRFYEMGLIQPKLTEYDFVAALNEPDGGDWEAFLTDWLFHIGDYYIDQRIERYE